MIVGKLQSKFGLRKAFPRSFGKQRLVTKYHQKAVTKFERKTFMID